MNRAMCPKEPKATLSTSQAIRPFHEDSLQDQNKVRYSSQRPSPGSISLNVPLCVTPDGTFARIFGQNIPVRLDISDLLKRDILKNAPPILSALSKLVDLSQGPNQSRTEQSGSGVIAGGSRLDDTLTGRAVLDSNPSPPPIIEHDEPDPKAVDEQIPQSPDIFHSIEDDSHLPPVITELNDLDESDPSDEDYAPSKERGSSYTSGSSSVVTVPGSSQPNKNAPPSYQHQPPASQYLNQDVGSSVSPPPSTISFPQRPEPLRSPPRLDEYRNDLRNERLLRAPNRRKTNRWSSAEEKEFVRLVNIYGHNWMAIKAADEYGDALLQKRTNKDLRDKAVGIARQMIKSKRPVHDAFRGLVRKTNKDGEALVDEGFDWD